MKKYFIATTFKIGGKQIVVHTIEVVDLQEAQIIFNRIENIASDFEVSLCVKENDTVIELQNKIH